MNIEKWKVKVYEYMNFGSLLILALVFDKGNLKHIFCLLMVQKDSQMLFSICATCLFPSQCELDLVFYDLQTVSTLKH